jgi:hypothetical protein
MAEGPALICTCFPGVPAAHTEECAFTRALPTPVECICGSKSGIPHEHWYWIDRTRMIVSAALAPDDRRCIITTQAHTTGNDQ